MNVIEWIEQLENELEYCDKQLKHNSIQQIHFKKQIKELNFKINKLNDLGRTESAKALKKSENIKRFLKKE